MNKIVVIGATIETENVIRYWQTSLGKWCIAGFLSDDLDAPKTILNTKYLGPISLLEDMGNLDYDVCLACSNMVVRTKVFDRWRYKFPFRNVVGAILNCSIGEGNYIYPSVNTSWYTFIGNNNIVLDGTSLSSHCNIGDNNYIGMGCSIGRNVTIGDNCFVNHGAIIGHDVVVDDNSVIDAGEIVTSNVI